MSQELAGERPRLPGDAAAGYRWEPYALVAVRIGPVWTDIVAIVGEDQTLAMRHRTNDDPLILPAELPRSRGRCGAVTAAVRTCSPSCSSCHERAHR